jgi:hypothetical protein
MRPTKRRDRTIEILNDTLSNNSAIVCVCTYSSVESFLKIEENKRGKTSRIQAAGFAIGDGNSEATGLRRTKQQNSGGGTIDQHHV